MSTTIPAADGAASPALSQAAASELGIARSYNLRNLIVAELKQLPKFGKQYAETLPDIVSQYMNHSHSVLMNICESVHGGDEAVARAFARHIINLMEERRA